SATGSPPSKKRSKCRRRKRCCASSRPSSRAPRVTRRRPRPAPGKLSRRWKSASRSSGPSWPDGDRHHAMRIAHVIPALVKGGAEKVVVDLANCAVANGDEVTLILAQPSPPELLACELKPEVKVLHICEGQPGRLSRYAMLARWLVRNRPLIRAFDVLHCHLSFGSAAGTLARWMRRGQPGPAIIETFHAAGMPIPKWKLALLARLARRRDALVLVAEDRFWRRFKRRNPDVPVTVIPNGIAID